MNLSQLFVLCSQVSTCVCGGPTQRGLQPLRVWSPRATRGGVQRDGRPCSRSMGGTGRPTQDHPCPQWCQRSLQGAGNLLLWDDSDHHQEGKVCPRHAPLLQQQHRAIMGTSCSQISWWVSTSISKSISISLTRNRGLSLKATGLIIILISIAPHCWEILQFHSQTEENWKETDKNYNINSLDLQPVMTIGCMETKWKQGSAAKFPQQSYFNCSTGE